jgi:RNA polymerase sigma-70 factor (ECF subfamily)
MEIDPQKLRDETYRSQIFTVLVQEYQDRICRYCVMRVGEGQGEEIAQEVFLTAWESLAKFRQESAVGTWLVGIAKNKCSQAFRNRSRRQTITTTFVEDIRDQSHTKETDPPEHMMVDRAKFDELAQGLSQLRDDERLLLTLRYYRELPVAEIAELLGKSEAAVRKRLLRSLKRLRQIFTAVPHSSKPPSASLSPKKR